MVELDQGEEFVGLGLGEIEFGGEIVGFVGKNFEVAGDSAFVANVGKTRGILGGGGEEFLLLSEFNIFSIADESIGNIAKRLLDCLLIGKQSSLLLGLGEIDLGMDSAGGENGLGERTGEGPRPAGPVKRRESASLWKPPEVVRAIWG